MVGQYSYITISGEYEHRFSPPFGMGLMASYFAATPSLFLLAAPEFFIHPFSNDIVLSAAPLIQFSTTNQVGAQFGARLPFALGALHITPIAYVGVIPGGPYYMFGLGMSI